MSCAIDIVTDEEVNGVHKLDLDWFMELKSQRRLTIGTQTRARSGEMRQIKGVWKITLVASYSDPAD